MTGAGDPKLHCSFCRRSSAVVEKLLGGPGVQICDHCVGLCQKVLNDEPIPSFPGWAKLTDAQLLATLAPAERAVEDVRTVLQAHVDELRARGVSWAKIADALGVSKQAAWERFG
ncbi:MAG: hypothetical protein GC206_10100 [Alphaproteobacteria bacterium]|nr:hypothetical protein [Alphaproteobacteria bacterium]